ncbi:MAG: hypothetical protein U5N55_01375 [Cypionkella sp.]|nr:hypothetical protein [Cypionkella sp.]
MLQAVAGVSSTDYLKGRDPSAVFTECVKDRSGQFPTRAFTEFPPLPPPRIEC